MKEYKQKIIDAIVEEAKHCRVVKLRECTNEKHISTQDCYDIMYAVLKRLPSYKPVKICTHEQMKYPQMASLFTTLAFVEKYHAPIDWEPDYITAFRLLGAYGEDLCWTEDRDIDLDSAINQLSSLVNRTDHYCENPVAFTAEEIDASSHMTFISLEDFKALVSERMENTGRVAGVYEMDFKHKVFSAVHIMDGWTAWKFSDVIRASSKAYGVPDKLRTITEELQGKELTYFTHPASDIVKLSKLPLDEQIKGVETQNVKDTNNAPYKETER